MDLEETKSQHSSSDDSQEENIKDLPEEEETQEAPHPDYSPSELSQLVGYLRDMVVLFDLRECDWNHECLSVVEQWFLENQHPVLFIYYSPNNILTASLTVPVEPFYDATYFIRREANEIFQLDTFHDSIQYGTVHDPDESILVLMEALYAPYFFREPLPWSERVRVNFLEAVDDFLINVTEIHFKMSGLTILPMPPMQEQMQLEDEFTVRRLEKLMVHWMGQIRLFLGDSETREMLCPSDFYDFWVYRDEVLHCLLLQIKRPDLQSVLQVLEAKQSVYVKQFSLLLQSLHEESRRAADNMRFLSLLIEPCKQLEECKSPAEIPPLLPDLVRTVLFIQRHSKYLRQPEAVVSLFQALTNHIILYCRSRINIPEILGGSPREGIKLCSMSIDCCLAYREIFEVIVEQDSLDWSFDSHAVFNPVDTFIERLHDMILICEYSEINSMVAPKFGGTWGREFEGTCRELSRKFNEAIGEIRENKHLALDVNDDHWSTVVIVRFKETLKKLDEIFQNMIKTAFLYCRNIDDRVELLCTLINYKQRVSLSACFNHYIDLLYDSVIQEVATIKSALLEARSQKRRFGLCEKFSGFGFCLQANLKRARRLKTLVHSLVWLREETPGNVSLELDILEKLIQQDIQTNFEEWKGSIPDNTINGLQRSLLVRSVSRPGLIECNIDRNLVVLLREAISFKRLHFVTPINVTQLFQRASQTNFIFESCVTICLDYNAIIRSLSEKERLLFRTLIKTCDKKISAGIYKLNWAGEWTENYAGECLQWTRQIQDFLTRYKRTNCRIVEVCEEICGLEVIQLETKELAELAVIEERLEASEESGTERLMHRYREIVEQIVTVHEGLSVYGDVPLVASTGVDGHGNVEWCEYVRKIDKLLEKALCHCVQRNLQTIVQQLTDSLRITPFVRVQVLLDAEQKSLTFQPEIASISLFFGSLFARLLGAFRLFQRLQTHLRIPRGKEQSTGSFFDVLKGNDKCLQFQRRILQELRSMELEVASYAVTTWAPFQSQWTMDKTRFLERFDATDPTPESLHAVICKYAEIANQISVQSEEDSRLAIRFLQLNVTSLKGSIIRHIDEWQRLHMDLLAQRSFQKLDLIYERIDWMTRQISDAQPTSRQEMLATLQMHERITQEMPSMERKFAEARNHFQVMDLHNIRVPVDYEKRLKGLDGQWEVFCEKLKEVAETLQTSKDQFG